ncbi:valine--tRNA ligase, mitochondrial 1-like [Pararge aegeria]|uniref:valine--tRNA ligase, mitochondrial 1-like n=1 Tax=Pararge aegeria TaxID=116150 RepID=UPI0019D26910|nr:valine--tRNA ligase, mitochondrial 1-like [Pararge aegeria]
MIRHVHSFPVIYSPRRYVSSTTRIVKKQNLPGPAYKPELVENSKYDKWERKGIFSADPASHKPHFSLVLPPPNVTGKLHLGHALSCTIQDVIVRRKRSLGVNVLWVPGTDHAGIATQGVVEKYLKSTQNVNRHDLGRDNFNKEVWKWKERHGNTICQQLRILGSSLDWSRESFTMDALHTNAVNSAFINLFKKGLIYRKKALVNWCNALNSTVSDIEVENLHINGPTELMLPGDEKPVTFGLIYDFAYKVYGSNEEIVVSTTMPETMLGDTAIAVHPQDNRYKHLRDKKVLHPFRKNVIPIIFDDFVDISFGTGAVKITPAHSKVDFDVSKRHNLPVLQVLSESGMMQNAGIFNNMKKYECRKILIQEMKDLGILKSVAPHQMTLPICSRTRDVIDYIPKEQWFLSCSELNKRAAQVVIDKQLNIEPDKFIKNWLNWTSDNRDWCISRQLWWGHQIPAYKCCAKNNIVWIAAMDEQSARLQASKYLRSLPEDIIAERDRDVLDTWFSSGIYPFSSLGWPDHHYNDTYSRFYPLNLMVTGHDILGFWVHRMVILGIELTGQLPFNNVLLHGIICDGKGAKMSKSRGNVIDPIDVINGITMEGLRDKALNMHNNGVLSKDELNKAVAYQKTNFSNTNGIPECGVDALRFTLLSQDIKSHFINFDVSQCHANKLFCNKIWQSIKYMQICYGKLKNNDEEVTINDLTYFDKWILSRLSNMVEKVNDSMDTYEFHIAAKSLRTLIYNEFCDVYLEATKPGFDDGKPITGYAHAHTLSAVLNVSLRCLAPFMVYLTDELIPKIPAFEKNIIHNFADLENDYFDFPHTKDIIVWKNDDLEMRINKVISTINLLRELKGLYNMPNKLKPLVFVKTQNESLIEDVKNSKKIVQHLSRIANVVFNEEPQNNCANAVLDEDTEISIEILSADMENTILSARDKLLKKLHKLEQGLLQFENKISSISYVNNASEWTQILDREKLHSKKEELKRLQRLI